MAKTKIDTLEEDRELELDIHKAMEAAIVAFNEVLHDYDVCLGLKLDVKWFYEGESGVMKRYSVEEHWQDDKCCSNE